MAGPALVELRGPQRDGTAQGERSRPELSPGWVGIDERTPADLIAFARGFASHLLWYGPDNEPAGWWGSPEEPGSITGSPGDPPRDGPTFFDGIGPATDAAAGLLGYDEAAAFLDDAESLAGPRHAGLRRPHMALLLTAVGLMRHGQRALNEITARHLNYHLGDVLRLRPRDAEPDRAFVVFKLASGVEAAEVPAGLRLLAGRDSRHRDRLYRLDSGLVVNRAEVTRLESTFVDRETVGLAQARRAITGTPEEQYLFLVSLALGDPAPGDPLPLLAGKPVDVPLLQAASAFIGFSKAGLFLELFELRAMLARKAMRAGEAADWQSINKVIESAGRAKRGDPAWQLQPANPSDFDANLAAALGGKPDLGGLTEVETVDDLALHLDRDDVRDAIKAKLFMDPDGQFRPMITLKRSIDADWKIVNNYLELAGRAMRDKPDWALKPKDQAAFDDNLVSAIGPVKWADSGLLGDGVKDPDSYLSRVGDIEAWFFLAAEDAVKVIGAFGADEASPAGARSWRDAYALLAIAHSRKVRSQEAAALAGLRAHPPVGRTGPEAELESALGELPPDLDSRMQALARYSTADEVDIVRSVLAAPGGAAPAADWRQADSILAEARRRRLRLPEPVAEKDHWRSLWAYDDARSANSGEGTPWRCFGGVPADAGPAHSPAAIGWALASPILALSTGRRKIVLTLGFRDDGAGPLIAPPDDHGDSPAKLPFLVSLSGGKDWIAPADCAFAAVDYRKTPGIEPVEAGMKLLGLQVTVTLDETAPEVATSPVTDMFGETPWPVLRLTLRPVRDEVAGRFDTAYERFRPLKLERANIACAVGNYALDGAPGLWPLAAETETGAANAKKPFEPFGPTPSLGSELAVSHRDLLHKRLAKLALSFEWLGGPPSLNAFYANYPGRTFQAFQAQLSLVDGEVKTTLLNGAKPLFAGDDSKAPVRIEVAAGDASRPDPVIEDLEPEVRSWRRYLVVQLGGADFGHHDYAWLVASKSTQFANDLHSPPQGGIKPDSYVVNPPYTPKLKRIGIDFTASEEVRLALYDRSSAVDRLFHVHPFGVEEAEAGGVEGWPFLPGYDDEGALYVGLTGVEAPQSLSLLFAGADGRGAEERTGPVRWSYLDSAGWKDFDEPPRDSTGGLVRRGIVRFELPAASPGSRMPAGFYWLRAAMASGAANACDMLDVHAQAGCAQFVDDGAPGDHYDAPLPENMIKALADPAPGIAKVIQPYPASGGRSPEGEGAFRIRAAERLRHKGRALSLWDYERLVLERFPEVHKVKCLPSGMFDDAPGQVRLVIIPDLRGTALGNPFAPRAPARLLDEIAAFLGPLAPPSASIAAVHARFVEVRVRLGVRFVAGGDEEFDKKRLADALNRYLAPWAFDVASDIAIGQRIDATSIVAFVDQLSFVDFVGVCRLFASEDGGETFQLGDDGGDRVEARGEDQVLAPAFRHEIDVIGDELFEETEFTGIGYMKVELDFVVH